MKTFRASVMSSLVCVLAIYLVISLFWPTDSTDSSRWNRSGMSLLVDDATGCHYLSRFGSMTPRLNAEGDHICSGQEE